MAEVIGRYVAGRLARSKVLSSIRVFVPDCHSSSRVRRPYV